MDAINILKTIDRERIKAKISKRTLCAEVSINPTYYSDCLAGRKHGITLETCCKMVELLDFRLIVALREGDKEN